MSNVHICVALLLVMGYVISILVYSKSTFSHALTLAHVCFLGLAGFVLWIFWSHSNSLGCSSPASAASVSSKGKKDLHPESDEDAEDENTDDDVEEETTNKPTSPNRVLQCMELGLRGSALAVSSSPSSKVSNGTTTTPDKDQVLNQFRNLLDEFAVIPRKAK